MYLGSRAKTDNIALILAAFGTTVAAQWLTYPTPGIPRLPDGKPNLAAPATKAADGKPDFSGIWEPIASLNLEQVSGAAYTDQFVNLGLDCRVEFHIPPGLPTW